jgi:Mg-chelatase subunit ChlI
MPGTFPFSALVGQNRMKRALILNAIDPSIGGVLIMGQRGTAKSTAARGLAALLPDIEVIKDSPYNDDPMAPATWSDWAKERGKKKGASETRRTPFIDLPVTASEDRVSGTLDLQAAVEGRGIQFQPGLLAEANRGVLYIDEVNLLDDHIVDSLLDAAALGWNIVEREGFSFQHPARFILVGTMNPEEGILRPQLLDRFGLSVVVEALNDMNQRVELLDRIFDFEADPEAFLEAHAAEEAATAAAIIAARNLIHSIPIDADNKRTATEISLKAGLDGHRAEIVMLKAARALAAFENRKTITIQDIEAAAQLSILHRLKNQTAVDIARSANDISDNGPSLKKK